MKATQKLNINKTIIFYLVIIILFGAVNAMSECTHYSPVWDPTCSGLNPNTTMNLYIRDAKLDDVYLEAGDQIGVFDDEDCVGYVEIGDNTPSEANFGTYYLIMQKKEGGDSPTGFNEGHTIYIKVWDQSASQEMSSVELSYYDLSLQPISPPNFEGNGIYVLSVNAVPFVPEPTIELIEPKQGSTVESTPFFITGTNFDEGTNATIGGQDASCDLESETLLNCTAPPSSSEGIVDIVVTTSNSKSVTSSSDDTRFTYINYDPIVNSVLPNSGSTLGAEQIVISGRYFNSPSVTMGTTGLTNTIIDSTSTAITCTTLISNEAGSVTVVVTNSDLKSGSLANAYTYVYPAPEITNITPTTGATSGSEIVVITGDYFREGLSVTFAGQPVDFVFDGLSTITCTTNSYTAAGNVDVVVTNDDSGNDSTTFTYVEYEPQIVSVTPDSGDVAGGVVLTINGHYFFQNSTVKLGNITLEDVTYIDSNTLTCTTQEGTLGAVNVIVSNPNGMSVTRTDGYTNMYPNPPEITNVQPSSGTRLGGTVLTISGQHFQENVKVNIAGVETSCYLVDSNTITCTTLKYTAYGLVSLSVTNEDEQSDSSSYTYLEQYLLQVSAGDNGSILPSGDISVSRDANMIFNMIPASSYQVDTVYDNGISKGQTARYELKSVTSDHSITVTFKQPASYTITTADIGNKGSISPTQAVVSEGQDFNLTITPNPPYVLDHVLVNGVARAASNILRLVNITENKHVEAVFRLVDTPIANAIISQTSGQAPLEVEFQDNSTGNISDWKWDFGNGDIRLDPDTTIIFTEAGTQNVTFTVTGPGGTDTEYYSISVEEPSEFYVDFFATTPRAGASALEVTFLMLSDDNEAYTWLWDFGDGEMYEGDNRINPCHEYGMEGSYTVTVFAEGEAGIRRVKQNYITVVDRKISGHVTKDDEPIAGFSVEIFKDDIFLGIAETDEEGNYTVSNLPAIDGLIAEIWPPPESDEFNLHQFYDGKILREKANRISTISANATGIDFTLVSAENIGIQGQIRDAEGLGVADISVYVFSEQIMFGMDTVTDENGNYTIIGLYPGDYKVSAWSETMGSEFFYALPEGYTVGVSIPEMSVLFFDLATFVPVNAALVENIDIIMAGQYISGRVMSDDLPLPNIFINAWSEGLDTGNMALSDDNGYYTIYGLEAVSSQDAYTLGYYVEVQSTGYQYQVFDGVDDIENAVRVETNRSDINFSLNTSDSTKIQGQIKNNTGNPLEGIFVSAWSRYSPHLQSETFTDENGNYTLLVVPEFDYIVAVFPDNYPPQFYDGKEILEQATLVDATAGDVDEINFSLNEGGYIWGRVFDAIESEQTVVPNIWVNIWSESTNTGGEVQTDQFGRFEIGGLDETATDYIISIWLKDYLPSFYCESCQNSTSSSMELASGVTPSDESRHIVLQGGYSIKGIINSSGQPMAGVNIEAFAEEIRGWGNATSGVNGVYEIKGLPGNGDYEVCPYSDLIADCQTVSLTTASIDGINFNLLDPHRSISGSITGLAIGKPIRIHAWSNNSDFAKEVILSNGETEYVISGLKPGNDYVVECFSDYYPYKIYNNQRIPEYATKVDISSGNRSDIDFVLDIPVTISGTITFPLESNSGEIIYVDASSESVNVFRSIPVIRGVSNIASYSLDGLLLSTDYNIAIASDKYLSDIYENQNIGNVTTFNFTLSDESRKATISGVVTDGAQPVSGIKVEAFSDSTGIWGISNTDLTGRYTITGLKVANDYVIQAVKENIAPFFYNSVKTVRKRSLATSVTALEGATPNNINISVSEGKSITGTIRSSDNKALNGVWVEAWSSSKQAGGSSFSNSNGLYVIKGLPDALDYQISVIPDPTTSQYKPTSKTGISAGAINVNFVLSKGYKISGVVKGNNNQAISSVRVEIGSISNSFISWAYTDLNGNYTIYGLSSGSDYLLSILPPSTLAYQNYDVSGLNITGDTVKNITLLPASSISGYVYQPGGVTGIANLNILASSESTKQQQIATTNSSGYYRISNLPDASDYIIAVRPVSSYADKTISNQSTGSTVNMTLEEGGVISGYIKDSSGTIINNAKVTVYSLQTSSIKKTAFSNSNGKYSVSGLLSKRNSQTITDYIVSVAADGYPTDTRSGKKVGDAVDFSLVKSVSNDLTLKFVDQSEDLPPANVYLVVYVYLEQETGGLKKYGSTLNKSGLITFTGLTSNQNYQIFYKVKNGTMNDNAYWYQSGTANNTLRANATGLQTGSSTHQIDLPGTWQ